jgi:NADH-quinone oxidoreductase subunit C
MKERVGLYIMKCFSKGVLSGSVTKSALVFVIEKEALVDFLRFLQNHSELRFTQLLDIWGVDYPTRGRRFEVNYMLLSIKLNMRIIIKVSVGESEIVESATGLFHSAGWLEREVWDMYGVYFGNNKDLRRILTDYGFEGHPLRKDFPLSGFVEVRYDDGEKRVLEEPIELQQEYRLFNFLSPWEKDRSKVL